MRQILIPFFIALIFGFSNLHAEVKRTQHSSVELISEYEQMEAGKSYNLALRLVMDPHWHTYWKNPGVAGFAAMMNWELPEGFKVDPIQWPTPKSYTLAGLASFGYEGELILISKLHIPSHAKGHINIKASPAWLTCKDACIRETTDLSLNIVIGSEKINTKWSDTFKATQAKLPKALPENHSIKAYYSDSNNILTIAAHTDKYIGKAYFFPNGGDEYNYENAPTFAQSKTTSHIYFTLNPDSDPKHVEGLIVFENQDQRKAFHIKAPVLKEPFPLLEAPANTKDNPKGSAAYRNIDDAPVTKGGDQSLWFNLILAFFGGFILNLMPCVFPVLSIKVMGFVKQAQEGKSHAVQHALIFTLGALLSFWALAGSMIAIKASTGANVDWGYQLQQPSVVLALILVLFIMALNLFGLFEIGLSLTSAGQSLQGKSGMSSSFFSGILATVVATPCMAPMLGAALTYAFTQSSAIAMLLFTVICLGMCSPYIVLAMSPKLLKFVPKPGAWMETFKQSMGFLMMLAVIWLLNTLQKQIAVADYLFNILWGFVLIAVACWIYGKYCLPHLEKKTRLRGLLFTLILGLSGLYYSYSKVYEKPVLEWETFDVAKLEQYRKEGTPVFIDFTATWCATCLVNKRVAINPNAALFKKKGVVTMKADATNKNELISSWLAKYESAGVPMNLLYDGSDKLPIKFPESFTAGTMEKVLNRLPDKKLL